MELMQALYARWLDRILRPGLLLLVATFLVYALGGLPPLIALEALPSLWTLPLDRFLAASDAPTGWRWLLAPGRAESSSLLAIALLSATTTVCYLRIALALAASGERVPALIAALQVLVLLAAASGLVS